MPPTPSPISGNSRAQLPDHGRWLITGVSGFIGSHLLEALLRRGQYVTGLDNFSTGREANLEEVRQSVTPDQWNRFQMMRGDLTNPSEVEKAVESVDFGLHHAALGSVPKSIEDPLATHASNVTGFLHVMLAARRAGVQRVVYASSSAVYGDCEELPATEERVGQPLSPYAASKAMNELYAAAFDRCYQSTSIGLRYFNVFGPRQDPNGPYAAVIPRWIDAMVRGQSVEIYGDGETTRDFCHVHNIVEANLLAATVPISSETPRVYNVGLGSATSLNDLFTTIRDAVARTRPDVAQARPEYRDFRPGDVRHSCADARRIQQHLGFRAVKDVPTGLTETVDWFLHCRA